MAFPFFCIGVVLLLGAIFYAYPSLTGWRGLARAWPAKRISDAKGRFAHEVEVDWTWNYHWWVEVRVLDSGVHCQHVRMITPTPFHAPLLVPWSAVTDVIETEDSIEVRARAGPTDFRVLYPADLGFPAHQRPNKAPEPTPTSVMPRAILPFSDLKIRTDLSNQARVTPAVVVAHL